MRVLAVLCLVAACVVAACANPTNDDPLVFEPQEPIDVHLGPIAVGIAPHVDDFFMHYLPLEASEPVSTVSGDDFGLYYAFVSLTDQWPYIMRAEGVPRALPGERAETKAVAMASSADGTIHLVFDAGTQIRYVRMHPDGAFDAPVVLDNERAREPTLVISASNEVIIAWTRDAADPSRSAEIVVVRGEPYAGAILFGAPRVANEDCCTDGEGNPALAMSGPSLALGPEGRAHVLYEWSSIFNTTIDYVVETEVGGAIDGFSTPLLVADAAFSPCPALHVTPDGVVHVTYIRDIETSVFYARIEDGYVFDQGAIFTPEAGRATLALMTFDPAGVMHVALSESRGRIAYIRLEEGVMMDEVTILDEEGATARLTPRAGGFYVAPDGKPITAFSHGTEAQVAVGLPR